jgi:predicted HicB family RNase H-like nuclease
MAIAKKPQRSRLAAKQESPDDAAEKFIAGAIPSREEGSQEDRKKVPIMVRFDRVLLQRVDAAAKHRGISRSAWIQFTLSRALDQGEG